MANKLFSSLVLGFTLLFQLAFYTAKADLRASGPLDMNCKVYGMAGGSTTDFGKLGLDVYSMYSGESSVYDSLFGKGVVRPDMIRSNSGISIAQTIGNLLSAFGDKNCFARMRYRLSKEARTPLQLTFSVQSTQRKYDDFDPSGWFAHTDPIETLEVAVGQYDGISVVSQGKGTKEGFIRVTMDPKKLDVGYYPITFYAAEGDCHECLRISHVIVVQVYQPCPPRDNVCEVAIQNAENAFDHYKEIYRQLFSQMVDRSINCQMKVDQTGGACAQLNRHANGRYPNSNRREEASRRFEQCFDKLDHVTNETRGYCPEQLLCASVQDCQLRSDPYSNKNLADASNAHQQRIDDIRRMNCCSEVYNPKGGSGPRPAVVTDDLTFTISERRGVETYNRTVESSQIFNYTENAGTPTLRKRIVVQKLNDGRFTINNKFVDALNLNFVVKDPLRRPLQLMASWSNNNPSLGRPYISPGQWIDNKMQTYVSVASSLSSFPLGVSTLNFSVVLPNPTDTRLNVTVQNAIEIEMKAQFTDGGDHGPAPKLQPLYGMANKCLTHYGLTPSPGIPLLIWDCVQQVNQNWLLNSNGQLIGNGNMCVEVKNGAVTSGSEVVLNHCNNSLQQKWVLKDGLMIHQASKKCLNIKGATLGNGTPIIIWDCGNYPNEKWSWMKTIIWN